MENPYQPPLLVVGLLSGVVAGLIPERTYTTWLNRIYILGLGASVSWFLQISSVDWAYSHPFNPNDGAAKAMVSLLGWLFALIWPILPAFASVFTMHRVIGRLSKTSSYSA